MDAPNCLCSDDSSPLLFFIWLKELGSTCFMSFWASSSSLSENRSNSWSSAYGEAGLVFDMSICLLLLGTDFLISTFSASMIDPWVDWVILLVFLLIAFNLFCARGFCLLGTSWFEGAMNVISLMIPWALASCSLWYTLFIGPLVCCCCW